MTITGAGCFAFGFLLFSVGLFNFGSLTQNFRVKFLIDLVGHKGARFFYILVGLLLMGYGLILH